MTNVAYATKHTIEIDQMFNVHLSSILVKVSFSGCKWFWDLHFVLSVNPIIKFIYIPCKCEYLFKFA
jgi:hypothetical protein